MRTEFDKAYLSNPGFREYNYVLIIELFRDVFARAGI